MTHREWRTKQSICFALKTSVYSFLLPVSWNVKIILMFQQSKNKSCRSWCAFYLFPMNSDELGSHLPWGVGRIRGQVKRLCDKDWLLCRGNGQKQERILWVHLIHWGIPVPQQLTAWLSHISLNQRFHGQIHPPRLSKGEKIRHQSKTFLVSDYVD